MNKRPKKQSDQQSFTEMNQSLTGKKREYPQKVPVIPYSDKPTMPDLPDENPDPNHHEPDINEPDINDPTRTDEFPPIFNTK
jgi:hypothetical protein